MPEVLEQHKRRNARAHDLFEYYNHKCPTISAVLLNVVLDIVHGLVDVSGSGKCN